MNIHGLETKLAKIHEEQHEVMVEYGKQNTTPLYDPSFSRSRQGNAEKDLEKLAEREKEIYAEITALKNSKGFMERREAATAAIVAKRGKLTAERDKLAADYRSIQAGLDESIVAGADALPLVEAMKAKRDRIALIEQALDAINGALSRIELFV